MTKINIAKWVLIGILIVSVICTGVFIYLKMNAMKKSFMKIAAKVAAAGKKNNLVGKF